MLGGCTDGIPTEVTRDTDRWRWLARRAGDCWRRCSEGGGVVGAREHGVRMRGCWETMRTMDTFFDTPPSELTRVHITIYNSYIEYYSNLLIALLLLRLIDSSLLGRTRFLLLGFRCLFGLLLPGFASLGFFAKIRVFWRVPPEFSNLSRITIRKKILHICVKSVHGPLLPWLAQGCLRSTFSCAPFERSHMQ